MKEPLQHTSSRAKRSGVERPQSQRCEISLRPRRTRLGWGLSIARLARNDAMRIWFGALALIGGGALAFVLVWWSQRASTPPATMPASAPMPVAPVVRQWLDGTPLATGAAQPLAVAIIIDNAPESQPQSGLTDAPLVFEVPVEGRRTRLLAVHALPTPSNDGAECPSCPIGPVRSARPYFIGLAAAIGAPLVHVGGSPAAMAVLRSSEWLHMNQYFDPPFWRDVSRRAPFNVYTAASNLGAFVRTRGWEERLRESMGALWGYTDEVIPPSPSTPTIRLPYDSGPYVVAWTYDAQAGVYKRSQDGRSHLVRSGSEERAVTATNVVVLRVRSRVLDAIGRLEISALEPPIQPTSAPKIATVFTGGRRIDGTWDWNVGGAPRFQLLQTDGTPITLQPGTTWVEFIDWDLE